MKLKIRNRLLLFSLVFMIGLLGCLTPISAQAATTTETQVVTFFNGSDWWTYNDWWYQMPSPAYVDELGNYFVPLSVLHDAFGFYAQETSGNTVTVRSRDHIIYQGIDNVCVYINNKAYNDTAPFRNEQGVVMVPVARYLSALAYGVEVKTDDTYPNGFLEITRRNQTVNLTRLEVNKYMQMVTVYGKDYGGKEIPARYMICSTGASGHETPTGTYRIRALHYTRGSDPWYYFANSRCWVQYCTQISGNVCFHSVPYNGYGYATLSQTGYNALGRKASHGCVRLLAQDARFVWENCSGLPVTIYDGAYSEVLNQKKTAILDAKLPYTTYKNDLISYGVQ